MDFQKLIETICALHSINPTLPFGVYGGQSGWKIFSNKNPQQLSLIGAKK